METPPCKLADSRAAVVLIATLTDSVRYEMLRGGIAQYTQPVAALLLELDHLAGRTGRHRAGHVLLDHRQKELDDVVAHIDWTAVPDFTPPNSSPGPLLP